MKQNPISFQLKLNPEDFLPATEEEKQSQIIMRESVSFWKDGRTISGSNDQDNACRNETYQQGYPASHHDTDCIITPHLILKSICLPTVSVR